MATKRRKETKTNVIRYFDYSMLAVLIFLTCFGLIMLYSASSYTAQVEYNDSMYFFKRQLVFIIAGFVAMFLVSRINYHRYIKWSKWIYLLAMFLMLLVQTPFGVERNNARRWLKLPVIPQFQPSEITKIAVILLCALLICKMGKGIRNIRNYKKVALAGIVAAAGVYLWTENLSTAIIVIGIVCVLIFVAHPKTAPFVAAVLCGGGLVGAFVMFLGNTVTETKNFRLNRILIWLHPEDYADGKGFQTLQGLYAIGSGGFFGKGLGNGAQKMFVPEAQNDMILSIICEELGVFGAIVVMVLFGMLLYRMLFIAQNAPDLYGSLIVTGVMAHIAIQVILNVMVVTNLMPNTGITLPFISYGGSSVLFLMIEMGIVLGISRRIKFEE